MNTVKKMFVSFKFRSKRYMCCSFNVFCWLCVDLWQSLINECLEHIDPDIQVTITFETIVCCVGGEDFNHKECLDKLQMILVPEVGFQAILVAGPKICNFYCPIQFVLYSVHPSILFRCKLILFQFAYPL